MFSQNGVTSHVFQKVEVTMEYIHIGGLFVKLNAAATLTVERG